MLTMSVESPQHQQRLLRKYGLFFLVLAGTAGVLFLAVGRAFFRPSGLPEEVGPPLPRQVAKGKHLAVWWDVLPEEVLQTVTGFEETSNIHPGDYIGPQTCQKCHQGNYEGWSHHPHRWMNMPAEKATVKGDFSGTATLSYRGGKASFLRQGDKYLMRLERDGERRGYEIHQTIGSRFFQYYVGKQIEGPEPRNHPFYRADHALPFGYWLTHKEWVPVVHIGPEVADARRPDPYQPPETGMYYAEYARSCNFCHTTFPLGDLFGRRPTQMGEQAPLPLHWSIRPYLEETHADVAAQVLPHLRRGEGAPNPMQGWEASRYAVTFGVSCEACHLGSREHVESGGRIRPRFFPASPHLHVEKGNRELDFGRSHDNVNWACGRCHIGKRPQFAAGMSTWNSVEYSDAMRGSCYSRLRCIDCHDPHQAIGPRWSHSADHDDAVCLRCHEHLKPADARTQHTHHPMGSAGARCMSCHMPRINEGIEDVVRTHMIYSPNRADMIEANHPNACNLCHTDKPIDWTLKYLKQWYGSTYKEERLAANYPKRSAPVGKGWLKSDNASVRLVAAEAMTRAHDRAALPELLDALDDPYLINRQFAYKGLEEMLQMRLADQGYRFYMTAAERRQPLAQLRARLCPGSSQGASKGR
jgi:hypothetical protein